MNKRAGLSRAQGLRCSGSQFETRVQVADQGSLTLRQVEGERLAGPLTQPGNGRITAPALQARRTHHRCSPGFSGVDKHQAPQARYPSARAKTAQEPENID